MRQCLKRLRECARHFLESKMFFGECITKAKVLIWLFSECAILYENVIYLQITMLYNDVIAPLAHLVEQLICNQ